MFRYYMNVIYLTNLSLKFNQSKEKVTAFGQTFINGSVSQTTNYLVNQLFCPSVPTYRVQRSLHPLSQASFTFYRTHGE